MCKYLYGPGRRSNSPVQLQHKHGLLRLPQKIEKEVMKKEKSRNILSSPRPIRQIAVAVDKYIQGSSNQSIQETRVATSRVKVHFRISPVATRFHRIQNEVAHLW